MASCPAIAMRSTLGLRGHPTKYWLHTRLLYYKAPYITLCNHLVFFTEIRRKHGLSCQKMGVAFLLFLLILKNIFLFDPSKIRNSANRINNYKLHQRKINRLSAGNFNSSKTMDRSLELVFGIIDNEIVYQSPKRKKLYFYKIDSCLSFSSLLAFLSHQREPLKLGYLTDWCTRRS